MSQIVVAVGGTGSSGTSIVAGMLQELGIPMGRLAQVGTGHARPYTNYECLDFLRVCRETWPWFTLEPTQPLGHLQGMVLKYLTGRRDEGPVIGLKRPQAAFLCSLVEGLDDSLDIRPVWCTRPLEDVLESYAKYEKLTPQKERFISQLWGLCEGTRLARPNDLCLPFGYVKDEPGHAVDQLCEYLSLYAGEGEKARAVGVVQ